MESPDNVAKQKVYHKEAGVRCSTRSRTTPQRFDKVYNKLGSAQASMAMTEVEGEIFSMRGLYPTAMASSSNPDIMYYHEAMRQPDSKQFTKAAIKEYQDIIKKGILEVTDKSKVPKDTKIFKSVWAMRCKRRILSREIYKWKARLNFDGSKQIKDVDYDLSYAPVITWESVRVLLALILRNNWHTMQLDFM